MYLHILITIFALMGSSLLCACQSESTAGDSPDLTHELVPGDDVSYDISEESPLDWSVFEPGPYRIGFDDFFVSYTPAGAESERELRVAYWYPTLDESGEEGRYAQLFSREEVFARATIAPGATYPVLIFSHGYQGIAEQSYFMTEFLTSHGWIVLAPEHTGNTTMDTSVPDHLLHEFRPQDLSAVIDTMEGLTSEHRLFEQFSDVLAVSGHSFGGYTTLSFSGSGYDMDTLMSACDVPESEACLYVDDDVVERYEESFLDPRVDLAIPMAPAGAALFGQEGLSEIEIPVLLMTGNLDLSTTNAAQGDPIWSGLDGETDLRIEFLTGAHFTFSNGCDLFPTLGAGDGCLGDFIDAHEANNIINIYVLSFLRYHLFGDLSVTEILDGTLELHPDVLLVTKE